MEYFHKLYQARINRLILALGMLALCFLIYYTLTFQSTSASFPTSVIAASQKGNSLISDLSSENPNTGESSWLRVSVNSTAITKDRTTAGVSDNTDETEKAKIVKEINSKSDNDGVSDVDGSSDLEKGRISDVEFSPKLANRQMLKNVKDRDIDFTTLVTVEDSQNGGSIETAEIGAEGHWLMARSNKTDLKVLDYFTRQNIDAKSLNKQALSTPQPITIASNVTSVDSPATTFSGDNEASGVQPSTNNFGSSLNDLVNSSVNPELAASYRMYMRKKQKMPTRSIADMARILQRTQTSSHSVSSRWSSAIDHQILAIRLQIDHPPIVRNDQELHGPAFRNISIFKRSYELMEQTLRVYIYKEGDKPVFHQPKLRGIYAAEGWFMKLMKENRHFAVTDPRKAHLFYIPFSSCFLKSVLYVPGSRDKKNLRAFLHSYVELIAAKYPFWNRTGGSDHFIVACHDWAPYETSHIMDHCIRALCNADLADNFRLGKDVSLAETLVRFKEDPLRDLSGKPPENRDILAFYAGRNHGYFRSVLLQHWENKDPDMKIFGSMPPELARKMDYIQHMKSSKYCICPRGYEVHSARVVEAIFYECVPVIISDNYVPPFFEVLNWEAFAVFVAEADVSKLKDILVSIPEVKYLSLHMGVRKVQKHFLWHSKPIKYDLFHMILHSIWYNRVYTLKPR